MGFWEDYLNKPPSEVTFDFEGDPSDTHAVLWRGYQDFSVEELWNFGSGMAWDTYPAPLPNFVEYGGRTLCDLEIRSGAGMYGPRWRVFDDSIGEGERDPALLDVHGISCMICRRKLMYGVSRIIDRLSTIRNSVGEDYVLKEPLIHGKQVLSSKREGSTTSEMYRYSCEVAAQEVNPRLVDDVQNFELITCSDCISNIKYRV